MYEDIYIRAKSVEAIMLMTKFHILTTTLPKTSSTKAKKSSMRLQTLSIPIRSMRQAYQNEEWEWYTVPDGDEATPEEIAQAIIRDRKQNPTPTKWIPTEDELVSLGFEKCEPQEFHFHLKKQADVWWWEEHIEIDVGSDVGFIESIKLYPKSLEHLKTLISMMTP